MNTLNAELKKLDVELYKTTYVEDDNKKREQLWTDIKKNKKILEHATTVVKNKFGDTFLSPTIVECILIDYQNIAQDLYQSLVNKIYSNPDLARIIVDVYSNDEISLLLYTLFNDNLELTEVQKNFALEEAMSKVGTKKYNKRIYDYEQELKNGSINYKLSDGIPKIRPIGAKTFNTNMTNFIYSLSINKSHGKGKYDIRYHILKNHNFTAQIENLIFEFYDANEYYTETVDYWEKDIVNLCTKENEKEPMFCIDEIMVIKEEEVFRILPLEQANKVIREINFIKMLHKIRPMHRDLDKDSIQKKLV